MNAKAAAVATEIVRAKPSARRKARALKTSIVHIQFETDGADIHNEASRAGGIELASQVADLHIDNIGLRHECEIPHILEQHRARHDLAGPAHKVFQQGEFPWQEIDKLAVAADGSLDKIHLKGPNLQSGKTRVAAPAQERFDARREFADIEWLDQIIDAAGFQSVDTIVDRRKRADHQG